MKHLIIGEAPNGDGEPFSGRSGRRLDKLFGGKWRYYCNAVNLFDEPLPRAEGGESGFEFPIAEAKVRAGMMHEYMTGHRCSLMIVTGKRVAAAFNLDLEYFQFARVWIGGRLSLVVVVPHPSGTNRWWNDPVNVDMAMAFFQRVLREMA